MSLYVPHTTAAVIVNEGYDPDVAGDMEGAFDRMVPRDPRFRHAEGNSDSHIKTALIGNSVSIFVTAGRLELGQWQKIFFCEFDRPAPAPTTSKNSLRLTACRAPAVADTVLTLLLKRKM